jgi:TPR repeat protein
MVVQKNLEKVRKLYESAEAGDINAIRNFGKIYFESSGVQPDYVKAFQFVPPRKQIT